MLKNYLRVALRNLVRDRMHSFIHITGLAVGMAIAILIGLWVRDELRFDRENPHYARVARVMQNQTTNGVIASNISMPLPLANELRTTYGGNFVRVVAAWWTQDHVLSFEDKKLVKKGRFMEPGAAEVMGLRMVKGGGAMSHGATGGVATGDVAREGGADAGAAVSSGDAGARARSGGGVGVGAAKRGGAVMAVRSGGVGLEAERGGAGAGEMSGGAGVNAGDGLLDDPNSILLSESAAKAVFGDADPMGKTMTIDTKMVVRVKGIYADVPNHSYFKDVLFVAPLSLFASANPWVKDAKTNWGFDMVEEFVQLREGVDLAKLSASLRNSTLDKMNGDPLGGAYHPQVFLYPMSRWHLYGDFRNGVNAGGNIQFVWLFGTIGFFVLLLACINFMNLATARSERRAREVGIRKAIGGLRRQLIAQFYCESMVVAMAAFVVALGLVLAALPWFNSLADKKIVVDWGSPLFWTAGIGFALLTGLLAGSYPALYLSGFQPVKVLKGAFKAGPWAGVPRRALVVLQFTVSVLLIIGTIVVYQQIQFAKDRSVGYKQGGLVSMLVQTPGFAERAETVRQELLRTGVVEEAAIASSSTSVIWDIWTGYSWRGKDPALQGEFASISVSPGYGRALGWQLVQGRDFSSQLATDSSAVMINETAVKFMGLKNPIGETIKQADGKMFRVIGVVRDIVVGSPYERVQQTLYTLWQNNDRTYLFIRLKPGQAAGTALSTIRTAFQRIVPTEPFDYKFTDEEYARKFAAETRIGALAAFFAGFALLISALGIFGMASFVAEQRRKEMGVRRVLGGSVVQIWGLLSREFVVMVGVSFLIGGPMGYYFMHRWLEGYVFHAGIPWWVFATTGVGVFLVTMVTVSFQSIRAARMNPVDALRSGV